ncbi:hypothetical protein MAHJHV61_33300 [Mycobacterium avium subsp. hominissuis]
MSAVTPADSTTVSGLAPVGGGAGRGAGRSPTNHITTATTNATTVSKPTLASTTGGLNLRRRGALHLSPSVNIPTAPHLSSAPTHP